MSISLDSLEQWNAANASDINTQLAATVLANFNADEALASRAVAIKNSCKAFNTSVKTIGAPVTNQKASGRCWLFAAGNVLRLPVMEKLQLKEFQFSQSYWFFYDKLEKCNFFLQQFSLVIDTDGHDVLSRLVLYLLADPTCDGGQFDMFVNVAEKYGMVPHELYPDAYSSTASRTLNFVLKTKLREFAEQLRDAKTSGNQDLGEMITDMQKEIYRLMVIFLGQPPALDKKLVWDYKDKNDEVHTVEFTPALFYKETVGVDLTQWVSLLNDPRNEFDRRIAIDRLGNVVGGRLVLYLNVDIDALAQYAVAHIKSNNAVFFGTHTPIYMDKKRGIMDESLFNYSLIGFKVQQSKAKRIEYQQSLMTHAMVLTAVHLDANGNPVRWRVENSWGKDLGQDGYYVMDHQYFKDYVYQIVVDKSALKEKHSKILDSDLPITLPPWDPMGALATFKDSQ